MANLFYNPYSQTSILPSQADIQNMIMMMRLIPLIKQMFAQSTQTPALTQPYPQRLTGMFPSPAQYNPTPFLGQTPFPAFPSWY